MPNSFLKKKNLSFGRGFVNISASCNFVSMNFTSQSPLFTWSLMKWWRISMCLVLECWIWFLVRFIALVLSQSRGTSLIFNPKSASCYLSQSICAQQLLATMYSASAVERATQACFLLCQEMRLDPRRWQVPLVLFLSSSHPAKSKSEQPIKCIREWEGYHRPTLVVPLIYLRILFATLKWDSFGFVWYLAQRHTTNMISGLLAVR